MRKPSRGSVIILITTPIIGCLLLWHVIFPLVDSGGDLHDLLAWKSSKELDYSDDGYLREDSEGGGGFNDLQSPAKTGNTNTAGSGASTSTTRSNGAEPATDYNTNRNNVADAGVNNNAPVAVHRQSSHTNSGNTNNDTRTENIQTDAERIASIVSAAEQMKRAGEQVKAIKKGKDDQSKVGSGGNGLLLLPPDEGDPVDVPIDGGLSVLLTAALGYGVRKTGVLKRKKKNDNSNAHLK